MIGIFTKDNTRRENVHLKEVLSNERIKKKKLVQNFKDFIEDSTSQYKAVKHQVLLGRHGNVIDIDSTLEKELGMAQGSSVGDSYIKLFELKQHYNPKIRKYFFLKKLGKKGQKKIPRWRQIFRVSLFLRKLPPDCIFVPKKCNP